MASIDEERIKEFKDVKFTKKCEHPDHDIVNKPMLISLQNGQKMTHTCPACGHKSTIVGRNPTY